MLIPGEQIDLVATALFRVWISWMDFVRSLDLLVDLFRAYALLAQRPFLFLLLGGQPFFCLLVFGLD